MLEALLSLKIGKVKELLRLEAHLLDKLRKLQTVGPFVELARWFGMHKNSQEYASLAALSKEIERRFPNLQAHFTSLLKSIDSLLYQTRGKIPEPVKKYMWLRDANLNIISVQALLDGIQAMRSRAVEPFSKFEKSLDRATLFEGHSIQNYSFYEDVKMVVDGHSVIENVAPIFAEAGHKLTEIESQLRDKVQLNRAQDPA